MPKKPKPANTTSESDVKQKLLNDMNALSSDSDEFAKLLDRYKTLCAIETSNRPERVGIKPWIPAIGNVAGVFTMGAFEKFGAAIFTTKALNVFGNKLR